MTSFRTIGTSLRRREGREKLTGRASYVGDLHLPGMACGRLILSPHAHARVRRIETAEAERVPGVLAVLTAGELGREGLLAADEVFYVGEPVAIVVAEDEAAAEDGAQRVRVEYEPLPVVLDPVAAMRPDSPLTRPAGRVGGGEDAEAHGDGGAGGTASVKPRNVSDMARYQRGDLERGWSLADVVIEDTYRIARVHQGYLETHGCVGQPGTDGVTVWASTQGQFFSRRQTAQKLGLPEHRVRIVPMTVGGGFGGKIHLLEPLAAAAARQVGRPVRIVLDRIQDFLVSHPAPAAVIRLRMGARGNGTLVALQAELIFDSGAAPGSPVGIAALMLGGTYRVPNLEVTAFEVLTHKTPVGAYRAPGAPQAFFALESHMDRLARRLGVDPVELRLRNAAREGDERPNGKPWPRIGLVECLERLRAHPLWSARKQARDEGYGVAVGGWPGGLEPAAAACRVNEDGSLTVQVGSVDLTGTHTTLAMIAAEVFGLSPDQVQVVAGDTDHAPFAGMTGGSKITYTVGAAVLRAAEETRRQVLAMAADHLEVAVDDLVLADGRVFARGAPAVGVSIAELARRATQFGGSYPPLHGHARLAIDQQSPGFAAHLARVRVDRRTGAVRVAGYLAVQDVGRALNPAEVIGQVRGGVTQGIGRALFERLLHDETGQLRNASLMEYAMPLATDVPEIEVELVEVPSPHGPFGAKGVGEPPVTPVAAAIANAVEDAVGVRITEAPLTPEAVLAGLRGVER